MNGFTLKAMAKINLGLDVVRRMENGYHQVYMVMQTVDIYDTLHFQTDEEPGIHVTCTDSNLPVDEHNLVCKAASALNSLYPFREGVRIELDKKIPMAAGMAGGSTDAAATLVGINRLFQLGISVEDLRNIAVKIGADVPYCITGGTMLSEGIGEILTPLPAPPDCILVIAKPEINVSTKEVYENLHVEQLEHHPDMSGLLKAIHEGNLNNMCYSMENVLETVTGKKYPVISEIEDTMKQSGALQAIMSGSGPTVFGIFKDQTKAEYAAEAVKKYTGQVFITKCIQNTCLDA